MKNFVYFLFVFISMSVFCNAQGPGILFTDENPEPDILEYRLYRSDTPCVDSTPTPVNCPAFSLVGTPPLPGSGPVADVIQYNDPVFTFAKQYFYRATAVNTSGLESQFSNELGVTWLNPFAPSPPGDLRELEQGALMRMWWEENDPSEHVNAYRVYKSSTEQNKGALLAIVGEPFYRDVNSGRSGPKWYRITAVNDNGVESESAGPVLYLGKSK